MRNTFYAEVAMHVVEALKARRYGDQPVYDVWYDGRTIFVRQADRAPYDIAVGQGG